MPTIEECLRRNHGPTRIARGHPNAGFTANGIQSAAKRFSKNQSFEKKEETRGRKREIRTPQNIAKIATALTKNPKTTAQTMRKNAGVQMCDTTVRKVLKADLKKKTYKTAKGQKLTQVKAARRLAACRDFLQKHENGDLDPAKIIFTDEKLFRAGKYQGGSGQICRAWVDESMKKAEVQAEHLVRESETWEKSVVVAAGISYNGVVGPYFVEKGVKIDADYYKTLLKNHYQPDIEILYPAGDYISQEDGAPAHTAKSTKAWVKDNMQNIVGKWPPTSPDLNVMDYYCWSHAQQIVNEADPKTELELKVEIKKAFASLSIDSIRKAVDQFIPRVTKCVECQGGHFEYKM